MNIIEQKKKEFWERFSSFFSKSTWIRDEEKAYPEYPQNDISIDGEIIKKRIEKWLEQALKETQEATIKAMLVEEREPQKYKTAHEAIMNGDRDYGFNQCCALQKERGQEIKNKLNIRQNN